MKIDENPLGNQCKSNTICHCRKCDQIFSSPFTKMLVSLRILNIFQQTRMLTSSEIDASSESVEKTGLRGRRNPVEPRICGLAPFAPVFTLSKKNKTISMTLAIFSKFQGKLSRSPQVEGER